MATIPRLESASLLAQPSRLPRQQPAYGLAQGLENTAQATEVLNQGIKQRDDARDIAWVTQQHSDDRLWAATRLNELIQQAPPDGSGVTEQLQKEMAQRGAINQAQAPSEQARFLFDQKHEEVRVASMIDSQVYEAKARGAYTVDQMKEGAAKSAAYLALHPGDLDKIKGEYASSVRALAKRSNMNAEALAQHNQEIFSQFDSAAAEGRIQTGFEAKSIPQIRAAIGDIKAGSYADMDANDVLRLRAEGESRINSLEAEQRALLSERNTEAHQALSDARIVVGFGGLPDNKALLAKTAGTDVEQDAKTLISVQADASKFARAPLVMQAGAIADAERYVSGGGISTPDTVLQMRLMRESFNNATQATKDGGGIEYYARQHNIGLGPIGDAAHREAVAIDATAWAGGVKQSPWTDTEIRSTQADIKNLDAVAAANEIVKISGAYPNSRVQLAESFAKNDPAMGVALGIAGDPSAAPVVTSILAGRKILAGTDFKPKRTDLIAQIPPDVVAAYAGHDKAFSDMVDAATAVYVHNNGARGDVVVKGAFEAAVYEVTGGAPINFNGGSIIPPIRGMTDEQLYSDMVNLTPADLITYGKVKVPNSSAILPATVAPYGDVGLWLPGREALGVGATEPITVDDIMNYGSLVDYGGGLYGIKMGLGVLMTDQNQPYLLDLTSYHEAAATRHFRDKPALSWPFTERADVVPANQP